MHLSISKQVLVYARTMQGSRNPYISLRALEALCDGDEVLEECLESMIEYALRYTETVCKFEQIVASTESTEDGTRNEIEAVRSGIHDATIASINCLSRTLKKAGKDNSWIGLVKSAERASYARFAMLIAFESILSGNREVAYV